jgi:hypothetical protein
MRRVFTAHVVEVAVAVPDDTGRFRTAVDHALNWWNSASAERRQIVLMPSRGQHRTAAEGFDHASKLAAIVDRYDVLIAVIDPTHRNAVEAIGGLVRAKRAGKLALAWFIAESPSDSLSADDQAWLSSVAQRLAKEGTVPRYIGRGDSLFESRLQSAITADLHDTSLSALTARFARTAQIRQVTTYRMPLALLGPQIWAVTVMNHSASLATGLTVSVDAVDSDGNELPDACRRSRQPIADVFAKLRTGPWPEDHRPLIDPGAESPARGSVFLGERTDVLAAHTALDFPRWLRPNQHASALYELELNASPRVRIRFEDEEGEVWSRTNGAEPERVSSPTERHTSCPQVPAGPTFPPTM